MAPSSSRPRLPGDVWDTHFISFKLHNSRPLALKEPVALEHCYLRRRDLSTQPRIFSNPNTQERKRGPKLAKEYQDRAGSKDTLVRIADYVTLSFFTKKKNKEDVEAGQMFRGEQKGVICRGGGESRKNHLDNRKETK